MTRTRKHYEPMIPVPAYETLHDQRILQGMTVEQIAQRHYVSTTTVNQWLDQHGIKLNASKVPQWAEIQAIQKRQAAGEVLNTILLDYRFSRFTYDKYRKQYEKALQLSHT